MGTSARLLAPRELTRLPRHIAVPPVWEAPNESSVEFLWSGYANLLAGGNAFVALTDPSTGQPFLQTLTKQIVGRLTTLAIFCPDMVTATDPYLFVRVMIGGQNANAWGNVPVYPRSGSAAPSFPMATYLNPGAQVQLYAKNTDAVNAHQVSVYLYGWYWAATLIQS